MLTFRRTLLALTLFLASSVPLQAKSTEFELLEAPVRPQGTLMTEGAVTGGDPWYVGILLQQEQEPVVAASVKRSTEYIEPVYFYRTQLRLTGSWQVHPLLRIGFDLPVSLLGDYKFNNTIETAVFTLNDLILRGNLHVWNKAWGEHLLDLALSGGFSLPTGAAEFLAGTDDRVLEPFFAAIGEYRIRQWTARLNLGWQERQATLLRDFDIKLNDRFEYRISASYTDRNKRIWFAELAGDTQLDSFFSSSQYNTLELYGGIQAEVRKAVVLGAVSVGLTRAYGTPILRFVLSTWLGKSSFEQWMAPPPVRLGTLLAEVADARTEKLVKHATIGLTAPGALRQTLALPAGEVVAEIPAGVYNVEVSAPDYYPLTEVVEIPANLTASVRYVLTHLPQNGWLRLLIGDEISSRPITTAWVAIGSSDELQHLAPAPDGVYSAYLPPTSYEVLVTAPAYEPKHLNLAVADQVTNEVNVWLSLHKTNLHIRAIDIETRLDVTGAVAYLPALDLEHNLVPRGTLYIMKPGSYRIAVTATGYFPVAVTFDSTDVTEATLEVEMTRKSESKAQLSGGQIYITENVQFRSGSSKIQAVSYSILDDVSNVVKEHSDITSIVVHGHTDNRGNRNYNVRLSERRAASVRKYLISRGISADILKSVGHGPDQPIADNTSKEGRAANRRVEFEVQVGGSEK